MSSDVLILSQTQLDQQVAWSLCLDIGRLHQHHLPGSTATIWPVEQLLQHSLSGSISNSWWATPQQMLWAREGSQSLKPCNPAEQTQWHHPHRPSKQSGQRCCTKLQADIICAYPSDIMRCQVLWKGHFQIWTYHQRTSQVHAKVPQNHIWEGCMCAHRVPEYSPDDLGSGKGLGSETCTGAADGDHTGLSRQEALAAPSTDHPCSCFLPSVASKLAQKELHVQGARVQP